MHQLEEEARALMTKLPEEYPLPPPNIEITGLTLEKLAPYIDLSEFTKPGYHVVYLCFDADLSGLMVQDMMVRVDVRISAVEQNPEVPEGGTDAGNGTNGGNSEES